MPRRLIKRYMPDHNTIRRHRHMQIFGTLLYDPNLWHLNRRSVSGAFAVGLFWAFVPIPFQMIAAAATAIPTRVNLPISVALVWISNPITMTPIFYFTYMVGTWLLGEPPRNVEFELTLEWMMTGLVGIWQPLYLGSLLCGGIVSFISYFTIRGLWHLRIVQYLRKRREKQKSR